MILFNAILKVNVLSHKNSIMAEINQNKYVINEYSVQGANYSNTLIKSSEGIDKLGYNGEVEDKFNLQYLRARYYNQEDTRFISEDTYRGSVGDVISHHLYAYVANDGVNNIDPSGHNYAVEVGVTLAGPGLVLVVLYSIEILMLLWKIINTNPNPSTVPAI